MSNNNDNNNSCDNRLERIKKTVKSYPNFPKEGIIFRDLFPILRDPKVFDDMIEIMIEHIEKLNPKVEAIIGLESRGFLLAPIIALRLKLPFIPIRKSGKLPGSVIQASYALEYGSDKFEVQTESITNGLKCVIIDDLLATGGSANASINLVNQLNGQVVEVMVIMELVALNGRKTIPSSIYSMIQY